MKKAIVVCLAGCGFLLFAPISCLFFVSLMPSKPRVETKEEREEIEAIRTKTREDMEEREKRARKEVRTTPSPKEAEVVRSYKAKDVEDQAIPDTKGLTMAEVFKKVDDTAVVKSLREDSGGFYHMVELNVEKYMLYDYPRRAMTSAARNCMRAAFLSEHAEDIGFIFIKMCGADRRRLATFCIPGKEGRRWDWEKLDRQWYLDLMEDGHSRGKDWSVVFHTWISK